METTNGAALRFFLRKIMEADQDYDERYRLILFALPEAHRLGYPVGFRFDPNEPEWPVVFIELPTGQCSWHLPQHPKEWDGHTTEEKFARIKEWIG